MVASPADHEYSIQQGCNTISHHLRVNRQEHIAKYLIAGSVNVNALQNNGFTPSMGAAQEGHTNTAKNLITEGNGVNTQHHHGLIPVMFTGIKEQNNDAK